MTPTAEPPRLDDLRFDNRLVAELPADPSDVIEPREVRGAVWSRVDARRASAPQLVAWSDEVLALLDLDPAVVRDPRFVQVFAGNEVLAGMRPHAVCYGGHQFGHWAGQLGDGRALNLGDVVNRRGERWALQLKGAGPTPYSRRADGLAVLRSSVREFLCSEAMHHLGVPTTRALSLVTTGDDVWRDMFYDGHPELEPGAIVCRVAPSFLRFGNYEIFAARRDDATLRQLADHTIRTHFAHLGEPSKATYLAWFEEVVRTTAAMVAHWQRVGFVHGVMNTDNMSIHGLTIDYGPYGWLEPYDPNWTPNTTDFAQHRYAFGNQPRVAQWNLAMLANALVPLIEDVEPLQAALDRYGEIFRDAWQAMMAAKLGFVAFDAERDTPLIEALIALLQRTETDMTLFFRNLADVPVEDAGADDEALLEPLVEAWYDPKRALSTVRDDTVAWLARYRERVLADARPAAARKSAMDRVNPRYVLRNYLAQQVIDKATEGDFEPVRELLDVLRRPYDDQPGRERFAAKRPEWARNRPGCSTLSCSS